MCDEFDDFDYDELEDSFDELDADDPLMEDQLDQDENEEAAERIVDIEEAFLFGAMVGGIAAEEEAEERLRKKLIKENDNSELVDEE